MAGISGLSARKLETFKLALRIELAKPTDKRDLTTEHLLGEAGKIDTYVTKLS